MARNRGWSGACSGYGRALPVLLTALAACHSGGIPQRSVALSCAPDRIGAVVVTGASRAELAPLTVLEGTLDDPART